MSRSLGGQATSESCQELNEENRTAVERHVTRKLNIRLMGVYSSSCMYSSLMNIIDVSSRGFGGKPSTLAEPLHSPIRSLFT